MARLVTTNAIAIGVGVVVAVALLGLTKSLTGQQASLSATRSPDLWLAEVVDEKGARREASWICADEMVRVGLTRAVPEINGAPCLILGEPLERPDLFTARCLALGQRFSVNATRSGDMSDNFMVRVRVRPLETQHPGAAGTIHYQKVGPCPANWRNGDSARMPEGARALPPQ